MNGSVTTFTYNNADQLLSQIRPGGKSVTYTIDATANLRTIRAEGAQAVTLNVNYESFLVTMQDGPTRVTFTYDSNGMTVEVTGRSSSVGSSLPKARERVLRPSRKG